MIEYMPSRIEYCWSFHPRGNDPNAIDVTVLISFGNEGIDRHRDPPPCNILVTIVNYSFCWQA